MDDSHPMNSSEERRRKDAVLSALGLCKKAGRLVMGFDVVAQAVAEKKITRVLTAGDLSPKSRKEIARVAASGGIPLDTAPITMDEIWYVVGRRTGILGVTDPGLSGLLQSRVAQCQPRQEEEQ